MMSHAINSIHATLSSSYRFVVQTKRRLSVVTSERSPGRRFSLANSTVEFIALRTYQLIWTNLLPTCVLSYGHDGMNGPRLNRVHRHEMKPSTLVLCMWHASCLGRRSRMSSMTCHQASGRDFGRDAQTKKLPKMGLKNVSFFELTFVNFLHVFASGTGVNRYMVLFWSICYVRVWCCVSVVRVRGVSSLKIS